MNTKIVTYTGKLFDLLNPTPDMVCIEDIAHSLSLLCRYTGHVREFYSVAQHCVLTAGLDSPADPLKRLLHDAAEAYIGDIARPWKQLLFLSFSGIYGQYIPIRFWEQKIQEVIGLALGIDLTPTVEVKEADDRMMATEIRDLMPESSDYCVDAEPLAQKIIPWYWVNAYDGFIELYDNIMKERTNDSY